MTAELERRRLLYRLGRHSDPDTARAVAAAFPNDGDAARGLLGRDDDAARSGHLDELLAASYPDHRDAWVLARSRDGDPISAWCEPRHLDELLRSNLDTATNLDVADAVWEHHLSVDQPLTTERFALALDLLDRADISDRATAAAANYVIAGRRADTAEFGAVPIDMSYTPRVIEHIAAHSAPASWDCDLLRHIVWAHTNGHFTHSATHRRYRRLELLDATVAQQSHHDVSREIHELLTHDHSHVTWVQHWVAGRLASGGHPHPEHPIADHCTTALVEAASDTHVAHLRASTWVRTEIDTYSDTACAVAHTLAANPSVDIDTIGVVAAVLGEHLPASDHNNAIDAVRTGLGRRPGPTPRLDTDDLWSLGRHHGTAALGTWAADPDRYCTLVLTRGYRAQILDTANRGLLPPSRIDEFPAQLLAGLNEHTLPAWTDEIHRRVGAQPGTWRLLCELAPRHPGTLGDLCTLAAAATT